MLRPRQVKNGTTGSGRISSVVVVAWLFFCWSRPAFPVEQRHLQLAPIQFRSTVGGNIGYTFLSNTWGADRSSQQLLDVGVAVGVAARTYLWQPWLARVTGAVGIGVSANTASYSMAPATKSGNTILTGDAALSLLQYSRFPFLARVYRQQNQASGFLSGINSNYMNNGLSLTQNYRSRDGRLDSLASYSHNTSGRQSFGTEERTNQLNLFVSSQPLNSHQSYRVVGAVTNTDHPLKGDSSSADTVVANHLYVPDAVLSVATLVNLIKTGYTISPLTPGISPQQSDYNSQQLSSFASWRPVASALTLTASARLLKSNSSSSTAASTQFDDTNLGLGANYAWSNLLRMYGSVNVDDNSGIQTVSTNAALAAQRAIGERNVINIGGFRYTRSVGASLSNQTTTITKGSNQTATSSIQRLGGTLGHDLAKNTQLGSGRLSVDLNQGLSTLLSTRGSPYTHLNSGGSMSWDSTEGKGTTMLGLRAVDSRDLSGTQTFFQLINLQASRNERVARNQSLIGNLTLQGSRSGARGVSTTPFIATPRADLTYRHLRLFGVKNMTFESSLKILGAEIMSSQNLATQMGSTNQASVSWDNDLNYFIGRLKLHLYTHLAEVNQTSQSSILFTMNRAF